MSNDKYSFCKDISNLIGLAELSNILMVIECTMQEHIVYTNYWINEIMKPVHETLHKLIDLMIKDDFKVPPDYSGNLRDYIKKSPQLQEFVSLMKTYLPKVRRHICGFDIFQ